ncbi:MAG: hypothetical protein PHN55_12295, partial [Dysgonamonadaceae bacterium]|nr:hypothetical protein [Dysgonamonadaceae bacterium]
MFFEHQKESQKREYTELLRIVGSLSHLFSESSVPYLYYRAAENIFCRAFEAENLSRGDVSADASKNKIGLGLKTFLHKNGATFQKVAEFNKGMYEYSSEKPRDIIEVISSQRNKRIAFTKRAYGINDMLYHLVTREESFFKVYEEDMNFIDLESIKSVNRKNNIIHFRDKYHKYKFNISKSTLFKQFITNKPIIQFEVPILEDPFSFLLANSGSDLEIVSEQEETYEHIYLPLYSARNNEVHAKSGLNQWNAGGRPRHEDELYIPVPIWIHKDFDGFFPYDLNQY